MKTTMRWFSGIAGAAILFLFACSKNNSSGSNPNIPEGQSKMSIYMMDGPTEYAKVLVDIRQVAILIDTGAKQSDDDRDDQWDDNFWGWHRDANHKSVIWDTLSITPGVYDLLSLRNGVDTLLGSGIYPSGKVLKVRVTLGADNTVYTDSATGYPLVIFGPNPYFDINVRRENVYTVSNNEFKLWLDFDLHRSIFFWSGKFYLSPYVIAFNDNQLGRVEGFALPGGASPLVQVYNATDTVYGVPGPSGHYLIRGVNSGTYTLQIYGHNGYQDTTITNVVVNGPKTTQVNKVTLHK